MNLYLGKTWPEHTSYSKGDDIPFSSSRRVVVGFLGEQGVDSIHHIINLVKCRYKPSIEKGTERFTYIL